MISCWRRLVRSRTSATARRSATPGPRPDGRRGRSDAPLLLDDPAWGDPAGKRAGFHPHLGYLGSGSDYTAFVDHLGIPAIDAGLRGGYGVYHSIYDDFQWMEKHGDPEFLNHATAARLYTAIVMRAASAEVVPFRFVPYGEALRDHVDDLRLIRARKQRQAGKAVRPGDEFEGVADLIEAVKAFQEKAEALDRDAEAAARREGADPKRFASLNDAMTAVERAFLLEEGLPGRPWFKHAVYAPGLTTGYASWPLPMVRQAIEEDDTAGLAPAVSKTVARIRKATEALEAATRAARPEASRH